MNKNLIPLTIIMIALSFTSYMLYKTFQIRASIQETSISLTKLELALDVFDCALQQAHDNMGTDHDDD